MEMKPADLLPLLERTKKAVAEVFEQAMSAYVATMHRPGEGKAFLQISSSLEAVEGMVREAVRLAVQQRHPDARALWGSNCASLVSDGTVLYDGIRFRSRTETRVYDALKRRKVLFFPNATMVLGATKDNQQKEPDFLVCDRGRWGVLEVVSPAFHPSPARDSDRARVFKDFGILVTAFYDADRCYDRPDEVVEDFLNLLRGG